MIGLPVWFVAILSTLAALIVVFGGVVVVIALEENRRRRRRARCRGFVGGAAAATCYHPPAHVRSVRGRQECTLCGAVAPSGVLMRPATYRGGHPAPSS